jgi:hypothetical protein
VGENSLAVPVREDLVSKFNNIAAKIENLRVDVQDSMAQLAMVEDSVAQRRHSI